MRIVLISCIPGGYSEREFKGLAKVLNSQFMSCICLTSKDFQIEKSQNDFYIVAEYHFNPLFDEAKHSSLEFDDFIRSLPRNRTAIYLSDPLFKFKDPAKFENWKYFVFFGLANYSKSPIWMYDKCKIWENVDISKKRPLDLPISELAFHSYGETCCNPIPNTSENDITYIINSKVKSRKRLLHYINGLKCQLGNFPAIDDEDVQNFVKRNPQNIYETRKAFGKGFLELQDGKYTLVLDDDLNIEAAWPMRIYEAMWNHVIPIFTARAMEKFGGRLVSHVFSQFPWVTTSEDLREVIEEIEGNPQLKESLLERIDDIMQKYVFDVDRLHRLSFTKISVALEAAKYED